MYRNCFLKGGVVIASLQPYQVMRDHGGVCCCCESEEDGQQLATSSCGAGRSCSSTPPPAAAAELLTATARRNALFRASQQGKLGLLGILKKCACFSSTTQVVSSKRPPSITTEEGESPTAL